MSAKSFIFLALWLVFNLAMYEIFGQNFGLVWGGAEDDPHCRDRAVDARDAKPV